MVGTKPQDFHSAFRNENGILLEGNQVLGIFVWKFERTFKLSDEKNDDFDDQNEERRNTHIRENYNLIKVGQMTDLNCNYNSNTDTRIHTYEILRTIQQLKHRAPGTSGINKQILTHCPKNIIYSLKIIYNTAKYIGYFSTKFKVAKIIPIPKTLKNYKFIENYRSISLLEILARYWKDSQ